MDIKKILKHIDGVEGKQKRHMQLNEAASMIINGDNADDVGIILDRIKGVTSQPPAPQGNNMRNDMDKFISAMGPREPAALDIEKEGTVGGIAGATIGGAMGGMPGAMAGGAIGDKLTGDEDQTDEWANEPDEGYEDTEFMTKDLSGGINKQKKMFPKAQDGDNAMAIESIKSRLLKALAEANAKPDFLDMDKDGNKKEPMKKAIADKKKKVEERSTGDYSAKKAHAGKDIGKPGKQFSKIASTAAKKYGSEKSGEKVAGAVLAKLRKK